jgi:hypothetical protein
MNDTFLNRTVGGALEGLKALQPSLFDILLMGIFYIVFIPDYFHKGVFFILYTIMLWIFSSIQKPLRSYNSIPLTLFVLWALISVFPHNSMDLVHRPKSVINYYFNVSMMCEGFAFILAGYMLVKIIAEHSKNLRVAFLIIPILFLQKIYENYICLKQDSHGGRITIVAAIAVSVIIYLFIHRKYILASIGVGICSIGSVIGWAFLVQKFECRPYVWGQMILDMVKHPLFGTGFNNTLMPDNMTYVNNILNTEYGWLYRHNDFLSIGAYLGVPALIFIGLWVITLIKRTINSVYVIPILAIVLTCFFQMTVFDPDKAVICLVLTGICIKGEKE